jgi:hypothetical protein
MKIDYEQIKRFLNVFESSKSPIINTIQIFHSLGYNEKNEEDSSLVMFYMKLLNDQDLIECISDNIDDKINLGFSFTGNQKMILKILNFRLTIIGHQALESMSNNKLWDKIKTPLGKLGIESLKQIPSLAIQILTSPSGK